MSELRIFGRVVRATIWDVDGTIQRERELVPGALDMFGVLDEHSVPRCICSIKPEERLATDFRRHELDLGRFPVVVAGCSKVKVVGKYIRANRHALSPILKHLSGIDPKEMLYFGDLEEDYRLARANGIPFVAITSGTFSAEEFVNMGVAKKRIVSTISEVLPYCQSAKYQGSSVMATAA